MKRLLLVVFLLQPSCAHVQPAPNQGPTYYAIPSFMRESDYLCTIDGQQGHCVRVSEVRAFLASLRAGP